MWNMEKGFGFVSVVRRDGTLDNDVFVPFRSLERGVHRLEEGKKVRLQLEVNPERPGKMRAAWAAPFFGDTDTYGDDVGGTVVSNGFVGSVRVKKEIGRGFSEVVHSDESVHKKAFPVFGAQDIERRNVYCGGDFRAEAKRGWTASMVGKHDNVKLGRGASSSSSSSSSGGSSSSSGSVRPRSRSPFRWRRFLPAPGPQDDKEGEGPQ